MRVPKILVHCSYCGNELLRYETNGQGKKFQNFFCNNQCKGKWQTQQRENLGFTKEWLYEQYVVKKRDCVDIAKEVDRHPKRVWEWIRDYGIKTRKRGYGNLHPVYKYDANHPNYGRKHTPETKEKLRQARLKDGHVPYLVNGKHWLKQEGVHSPAWKGGVTPERQALYASEKWRNAVKEVWHREDATCQLCRKRQNDDRDHKFHLHHVYPFAEYKHLRTNPDNLVLLCRDCHLFVHSKKNIDNKFMLIQAELPDWMIERKTI